MTEPPDLTEPLRERLAELDRLLEDMQPLAEERQRIARALAALTQPVPNVAVLSPPPGSRPTRQQAQILTVLTGQPGRLRARDVAEELGYGDANTIQCALRRMWERGLVTRYEIGDRRYEWEAIQTGEATLNGTHKAAPRR